MKSTYLFFEGNNLLKTNLLWDKITTKMFVSLSTSTKSIICPSHHHSPCQQTENFLANSHVDDLRETITQVLKFQSFKVSKIQRFQVSKLQSFWYKGKIEVKVKNEKKIERKLKLVEKKLIKVKVEKKMKKVKVNVKVEKKIEKSFS